MKKGGVFWARPKKFRRQFACPNAGPDKAITRNSTGRSTYHRERTALRHHGDVRPPTGTGLFLGRRQKSPSSPMADPMPRRNLPPLAPLLDIAVGEGPGMGSACSWLVPGQASSKLPACPVTTALRSRKSQTVHSQYDTSSTTPQVLSRLPATVSSREKTPLEGSRISSYTQARDNARAETNQPFPPLAGSGQCKSSARPRDGRLLPESEKTRF